MFNILPRYFLKEVLVPTFLCAVLLVFILLIQVLFQESDQLSGAFSLTLMLRLLWLVIPTLLLIALPISLLVGVLLGVGRLAVDSEIKAFRTHGVNLFFLMKPVLFFAFLATLFSLWNSLYYAPRQLASSLELIRERQLELVRTIEPGRFEDRLSSKGMDVVIYFDAKLEDGSWQDIYLALEGGGEQLGMEATDTPSSQIDFATIAGEKAGQSDYARDKRDDRGNEKSKAFVLARSGVVSVPDREFQPKDDDPRVQLELKDGSVHFRRFAGDERYGVLYFDSLKQEFEMEAGSMDEKDMAPTLTGAGLLREAKRMEAENDDADEYEESARLFITEFFRRISISLACFCFVLVGLPLAIFVRPSGKAVGIGVAYALIMVYYSLMHFGVVLTRQTSGLGPEVGPYLLLFPNVLFIFLGGWLMFRAVHR